ncbi:hypothetical protein RHO15_09615 [Utexia brackfieldae]|uniref:hypothetical protein n=1 Tax=Utexia brackfieldae TaxID=3074108 RepID=UPI00370D036E
MSSLANWSYTAKATIWRYSGKDEYSKKIFMPPEIIMCTYGNDAKLTQGLSGVGREFVLKDTFWTEYDKAKKGDYILLGESAVTNPQEAGAAEIVHVLRDADVFEQIADDYTLITTV